jgi:hypothetical protein
MPRGDRTGPQGMGPLTGRGRGICGGGDRQGFGRGFRRGPGRGFGRVMNPGEGLGPRFYGQTQDSPYARPLTNDQESRALQQEAEYLKEQLRDIETRLNDIADQNKS